MAPTVDGLVSGMSTSSMIGQLMQIEAQPQSRLKTKVSNAEGVVNAYMSVNTKLKALQTAGDDLSKVSLWRSIKPTSSSTSVTATATPNVTSPQTGSLTFDVKQLAKAQVSTARVDASVDLADTDFLSVQIGNDPLVPPVEINLNGKRTAQDVADAINSAGIAVKASVVKTKDGDSVLSIGSSKPGVANNFSITGFNGMVNMQNAVEAQDALIQVGGADEDGGYGVTSSSNTFTNLMNGVTLVVTKEEDGVTVNANSDVSGMGDKIKALVDAANAVLSEVTKQTKYDATTKKGSPLSADFTVRQISQTVLGAISQGQADIGSLGKLGVTLEKDGTLKFKKEVFEDAYNAEPAKFAAAGTAFGKTIEELSKKQTEIVTNSVTGRKTLIDSMNKQIDNWDVRLESKRIQLTKQYAALETALSSLKSKSSYLSSQLG